MVVQGQTAMEVAVYMTLVLLVVLLVVMIVMFGGPHLSQGMNHTSLLGANHKLGSFCHHV